MPTVQKDLDFGSNGLAKFNFGDGDNFSTFSEDLLFDLLLQSDGKILAAGQSAVLPDAKFALLRLNADGTRYRFWQSRPRTHRFYRRG
jgi:hypothetical protein